MESSHRQGAKGTKAGSHLRSWRLGGISPFLKGAVRCGRPSPPSPQWSSTGSSRRPRAGGPERSSNVRRRGCAASMRPFSLGVLILSLVSLPAGCAASRPVGVLRESEQVRFLPRGTKIAPPGEEPAFTLTRPGGAYLVDAGYLSRIYELLGSGSVSASGSCRVSAAPLRIAGDPEDSLDRFSPGKTSRQCAGEAGWAAALWLRGQTTP